MISATTAPISLWITALAGGGGVVWASFAATVALRMRAGVQWVAGRSRCDACHKVLKISDLAPLISYGLSGGRCRYCAASIPAIHPVTEVIGLSVALCTALLAHGPEKWLLLGASMLWLMIGVIDCATLRIPDVLVAGLGCLGFCDALLVRHDVAMRLAGALLVGLMLGLAAWFYRRRAGADGLGGGDIKLAAASALFIAPLLAPWAIVLAAVLGIAWTRLAGLSRGARIAFGPFLAAAFWMMSLAQMWNADGALS